MIRVFVSTLKLRLIEAFDFRKIGNDKSIKIKFNHEYELSKHWIPDLPLKVIIHGWLDSIIHEDGVSCIKTGKMYS